MSEDVPPELLESVREAVGRRVKLTLRRRVQLEVKGDKLENRVLALASHRAFLLTARVPSKVEHSFNYLDIQGISSNKPTQLLLESERGPWSLRLGSVEEVDEVIAHIGGCLQQICPASSPVKVMKKLVLKPPERTASLQAAWDEPGSADLGPCGKPASQTMNELHVVKWNEALTRCRVHSLCRRLFSPVLVCV